MRTAPFRQIAIPHMPLKFHIIFLHSASEEKSRKFEGLAPATVSKNIMKKKTKGIYLPPHG